MGQKVHIDPSEKLSVEVGYKREGPFKNNKKNKNSKSVPAWTIALSQLSDPLVYLTTANKQFNITKKEKSRYFFNQIKLS